VLEPGSTGHLFGHVPLLPQLMAGSSPAMTGTARVNRDCFASLAMTEGSLQ
jgi:hypothetical protein